LRFASHRDFQRALERALRRAEVPMAFSSGFSPHPKISYANAAPTGTASEAEYVEIAVVQRVDPGRLAADLDAALPPGLDVVDIVEARTKDFADRLQASRWRIELPDVDPDLARQAWQALWEAESVEVMRRTKSGMRSIDVRAALLHGAVDSQTRPSQDSGGTGGYAILRVVVRQVTPTVRPDDILAALRSVAGLSPAVPPQVTREAQGPLGADGVTIGDPFEQDRENRADEAAPTGG
jgi:radical SAM-linked protein